MNTLSRWLLCASLAVAACGPTMSNPDVTGDQAIVDAPASETATDVVGADAAADVIGADASAPDASAADVRATDVSATPDVVVADATADASVPDVSVSDASRPTVPVPAGCESATVTAEQLIARLPGNTCTGCHSGGSGGFRWSNATTLRTASVGVASTRAAMPRVTANNVDQSYLLYKITGHQNDVSGGGGSRMPSSGGALTNTQICLFVNWVRSGAN